MRTSCFASLFVLGRHPHYNDKGADGIEMLHRFFFLFFSSLFSAPCSRIMLPVNFNQTFKQVTRRPRKYRAPPTFADGNAISCWRSSLLCLSSRTSKSKLEILDFFQFRPGCVLLPRHLFYSEYDVYYNIDVFFVLFCSLCTRISVSSSRRVFSQERADFHRFLHFPSETRATRSWMAVWCATREGTALRESRNLFDGVVCKTDRKWHAAFDFVFYDFALQSTNSNEGCRLPFHFFPPENTSRGG